MSSMTPSNRDQSAAEPDAATANGPRLPGDRIWIGSLALDSVAFEEAVAWSVGYALTRGSRQPARISCPNASLVALADADPGFAKIVRSSNLVVADGAPLLWVALLLKKRLAAQIRGVDLMEGICAAGAARGLSFYILGGLPDAAAIAAGRLLEFYPGLRLAGTDCPPLGFERDPEVNRRVREKIAAAGPDFLIVALGSPKQEWWIWEHCRDLPVGIIQGVGAAVDTFAGLRPRPPVWMQRGGLEWLGRLLAEPRRLWRRYLFGNLRFVYVVFRQWLRGNSTGSRGAERS